MAKNRRANGHTYIIDDFAKTRAEATRIANKLRNKTTGYGHKAYSGVRIFPTNTGYEIGIRF